MTQAPTASQVGLTLLDEGVNAIQCKHAPYISSLHFLYVSYDRLYHSEKQWQDRYHKMDWVVQKAVKRRQCKVKLVSDTFPMHACSHPLSFDELDARVDKTEHTLGNMSSHIVNCWIHKLQHRHSTWYLPIAVSEYSGTHLLASDLAVNLTMQILLEYLRAGLILKGKTRAKESLFEIFI